MKPRLLLFGDSHSIAVIEALELRREQGRPVPIEGFRRSKLKDGKQIGDISFDAFLHRIAALAPDDIVLSMVGGSHYAMFGTIQHPQPFDFYLPREAARSGEDVEIIPFHALRAFLTEAVLDGFEGEGLHIHGDGAALEAMRTGTSARVLHIVAPPPIENGARIARRFESFFAEGGIHSRGVSPPALRRKLWALQTSIVHKFCTKRGIEVMMPPPGTVEGGFLREQFHIGGAHANRHYGERIIAELERRLLPA
ncbi:MAG TPA: hypothetical protein VIL42_06265 [Sphingomicrobium sp.]